MENVAFKIKKLRELKGYSREYMADVLNITERSYGKLENGESKLTLDRISQIAKELEIDPIKLIQFDDKFIFDQCDNSNASFFNSGKIEYSGLKDALSALKELLKTKNELIEFLKKSLEQK